MSQMNQSQSYVNADASGLREYISRVFMIMGVGLALTAFIAYSGFQSIVNGSGLFYTIAMTLPNVMWLVILLQLGIAIGLSAGIQKMNPVLATVLFFVYSAITGFTFSYLPFSFGVSTVFTAFVYASVLFICCAVIGHTTSIDLSQFSGLMIGGLIAMVVVGLLSMFVPMLRTDTASIFIGYLGLILFLFLTAWDMQKIKSYYYVQDARIQTNLAIYSAFQLYLDFINMFLYLLRILGGRSRD